MIHWHRRYHGHRHQAEVNITGQQHTGNTGGVIINEVNFILHHALLEAIDQGFGI